MNDFPCNILSESSFPTNFNELQALLIQCISSFQACFYRLYYNYAAQSWNWLPLIRDCIICYIVWDRSVRIFTIVRGRGIYSTLMSLANGCGQKVFRVFLSLPFVKTRVDIQVAKVVAKLETELIRNDEKLMQFESLPDQGLSREAVVSELELSRGLRHSDWENGRVSGAVYHGGADLVLMQTQAYEKYAMSNQLHPDVFPAVRKMEAEVVAMVSRLFHAPKSCGSTSSGGSELLLLAGLAAREFGRRYKGIFKPEVIAPVTVHAGIEKACFYFGMTLHKVNLDPILFQVDIIKVKRLINRNTVLIVGLAPNYPHGIIDDIESLSKLALAHGIPLHVDACLGSFVIPFLESSKVHGDSKIPLFDFRLAGVTSLSCDTHKYGFAPKGSSIILYRNAKLRECQYYVLTNWPGGMYGSPTLAGSRPGALMAGCWATLIHTGSEGYRESCINIVQAMLRVKNAIQTNNVLSRYLQVVGDPLGPVLAFMSRKGSDFDIYGLGDVMTERGWRFASLLRPAALHFAFTKLSVPIVQEMIDDLIECTVQVSQHKDCTNSGDTAALYGIAGSVKTVGVADRVIIAFLDTLYKTR